MEEQPDQVEELDRAALLAAEPEQGAAMLQAFLHGSVAREMGMQLSDLDVSKPLNSLGLDSMMILELRTTLQTLLNLDVPAIYFFEFPILADLCARIHELLLQQNSEDEQEQVEEAAEAVDLPPELSIDNMSDDEVNQMLAQMLAESGGDA